MKYLLFILVIGCTTLAAQPPPATPLNSLLRSVLPGDSIIYYQCHVREHHREVNLPDGNITTQGIEKYSVTEKFVVKNTGNGYTLTRYRSRLTLFPNRRFSGLKIREKSYWDFYLVSKTNLREADLVFLATLEQKGREAIEFDYAVTKYTTNQVIIKHKKDFKQLVIENGELIAVNLSTTP